MKTPEHDRLQARKSEADVIGAFLDWLAEEREWAICEQPGEVDWHPVILRREQILAQFLEIDMSALEVEKRAMLAQLRGSRCADCDRPCDAPLCADCHQARRDEGAPRKPKLKKFKLSRGAGAPWVPPAPKDDHRIKCRCCQRYMRYGLATRSTPAKRRPPPHASYCTDCPPRHFACGCPGQITDWRERKRLEHEHNPHCPERNS